MISVSISRENKILNYKKKGRQRCKGCLGRKSPKVILGSQGSLSAISKKMAICYKLLIFKKINACIIRLSSREIFWSYHI